MFKRILAMSVCALLLASGATAAWSADHYVSGYTRSNGTYVAPHYQTNPNSTTSDNYSTQGNVNPYTGQPGTKPDTRPSYGSTYTPYTAPSYGSTSAPSGSSTSGLYGSTPAKPACVTLYC